MESMGKMQGGAGMSPRKAMASGTDSGGFGVKDYPGCKSVGSPHKGVSMASMDDGARGIGTSVGGGKGMHGSQAAPDHGPHNDHFDRSTKA